MKKNKKILVLGLVCLTVLGMATSAFVINAENTTSIEVVNNSLSTREILHTAYNISVDNPTYTTGTFGTPSGNSNDINVSFTNDSKHSVKVSLYKIGIIKDTIIGSYEVSANSSDYEAFAGSSKSTYYVKITTSANGENIKGSLKVRQLD